MNTEKISKYSLWILMGVAILSFALFVCVGYDRPYEENPKYVAPLLTDLVLVVCYVYIFAAAILTVVSAVMQFTQGGSTSKAEGLAGKTGLIAGVIFIASLVIGAIVGIIGKDEVLLINGKGWNDPTDIILTDTSCISIAILTIVSVIAVILSMVKKK